MTNQVERGRLWRQGGVVCQDHEERLDLLGELAGSALVREATIGVPASIAISVFPCR